MADNSSHISDKGKTSERIVECWYQKLRYKNENVEDEQGRA